MNSILVSVVILLDLIPSKFLPTTSSFITISITPLGIMIILFNLFLLIKIFKKAKIRLKERINNSRQTLALDFLLCSRVITMLKYQVVNGKFMNRIKEIWIQVHFLRLISIWIKRKLSTLSLRSPGTSMTKMKAEVSIKTRHGTFSKMHSSICLMNLKKFLIKNSKNIIFLWTLTVTELF